MIYITGDTHTATCFEKFKFDGYEKLTKNDYLIVAGDLELIWSNGDGDAWMEKINQLPFTTLFIDGNYDNFDKLYKLPIVEKFGSTVGVAGESLFWLKRGEVYEIDGFKFLTVGGACSINKDKRTPGVDWWPNEELSDDDKEFIINNSEKYGQKVDFIVTHTCPTSILGAIKEYALKDSVSEFLEEIFYTVEFNKWYFGHMHSDEVVHNNFYAVFQNVLKVERGEGNPALNDPIMLID